MGAKENEGVQADGAEYFVFGDGIDVFDPGEKPAGVSFHYHGGSVGMEVPSWSVGAGKEVEAVDDAESEDDEEEDCGTSGQC